MAAEAEATDILLRLTMEGAEYFLRFTGTAAMKGATLFAAGVKALWEHNAGKQKLGGKIHTRAFLETFTASSIFTLSKEELNKLKPELKRLHIPYMKYKSSKEMHANSQVEISVRREDAERFMRLAEKLGIGGVTPYDVTTEELSEAAYNMLTQEENVQSVDATVTKDGIAISPNPTQAATDLSDLSAQNSTPSSIPSEPFDLNAGVDKNLAAAKVEAARRDGRIITLSINKDTLLEKTNYDVNGELRDIIVTVPGTKRQEHLCIPKESIITMDADGGQTILADLIDKKEYRISDRRLQNGYKMVSGADIRDSKHWAKSFRSDLAKSMPKPSVPSPQGR